MPAGSFTRGVDAAPNLTMNLPRLLLGVCCMHPPPQIVYLGGGALDAAPEVREFISRTGIPVAQTLMGLGTFPVGDKLSLQMLGMHGTVYANYAVDQVRLAVCMC